MLHQMKYGEMNFKKPSLGAINGNHMGNTSHVIGAQPTGSFVVGPKRPGEISYANDDDFWYGEKKDKRFGRPH